ncbi:MAG: tetratricopeptide repeat protein, partial [Candidatus Riflebacteria bacterium]|nr:tetratricopeptide repeat protein [Candidatus Riflebacteria bacterium]
MKLSRQISLFFVLFLFCSSAFAEISPDSKQSVYVSAEPLGVSTESIASEPEPIADSKEIKTLKAEPVKKAEETKKKFIASTTEEVADEPVKKFSKTMTEKELKEQDVLTKQKVMGFVVENQDRQAGEGWLFNARYYFELKQYDRAIKEIDTLIRSEEINPRMVWEAKLLLDEIYKEQKRYDEALKNLDKMIKKDNPARIYLVRAKIARAELLSRDLTGMKELLDAFKRYYWYFPEKKDMEAIEYLIGFQRGYDLEIAMQAMEAWEEISKFPEIEAANLANLHLAMLFAFDLNKPERSFEYLKKIRDDHSLSAEVKLINAVIGHFYTKNPDLKAIEDYYDDYCHSVNDLYGFRVGSILYGQFLCEKKKDYEASINAFERILHTPARLIASESISINKQREENDELIDWSMLACRMAGYVCEFKLKNLDRARLQYLRVKELGSSRSKEIKDPVNDSALKRTEPSKSLGEALFAMAYEQYRQQNFKEAIRLYDEFTKKYPESPLYKEALFRIAVIMDDDLRRYDEARAMYEHYIIQFKPLESRWNLDKLYDWGRVDEARYR